MTTDKQHAYQLLALLDARQLAAVVHLLEVMAAPAIPVEDELISAEEEQAVAASKEWFKHNKGIPFEEVLADFGLSKEGLKDYKEPA